MSNAQKDLRKQLRNLVQEELPGVLTKELVEAALANIHSRLDQIDERQKQIQSYLIRSTSVPEFKKWD